MPNATRTPSYRKHKPSGQAVVTLDGRDIYLGKYNTPRSRREYDRIIGEWTANNGMLPAPAQDLTITELLAAFLRYAKAYYRRPDGTQTGEVVMMRLVIARVKRLYGPNPAAEFGPLALKTVRQGMIADGLARRTVNQYVSRVRQIFKWGVENELVEPSVLHGLQAVAGLRAGRSGARESAPVKPVPDAFVDGILPHVSPQVAAMIELQRITGMRSGEVTAMRGCEINMAGKVWTFTPEQHKTAWHGHERMVYLGPKAQAIIKPFLKAELTVYIFSPKDAEAERHAKRFGVVGPERRTKVYPCELRRREANRAARQRRGRKGNLADRYDTASYRRAIKYGVDAENKRRLADAKAAGLGVDKVELVPHWHPHQLRHNAATALRREHGIEVARIILGHRSPAITEVYAEVDHARAVEVMGRIG